MYVHSHFSHFNLFLLFFVSFRLLFSLEVVENHDRSEWNQVKIMLERCMRSKFFIPLKWAPAQLCRIAEQEQVGEESQRVQSEEASEDEVVDGSGLACLRLFPSLCQREDSRGLSWLWSLSMVAMKWADVAGRKMRPRVFKW